MTNLAEVESIQKFQNIYSEPPVDLATSRAARVGRLGDHLLFNHRKYLVRLGIFEERGEVLVHLTSVGIGMIMKHYVSVIQEADSPDFILHQRSFAGLHEVVDGVLEGVGANSLEVRQLRLLHPVAFFPSFFAAFLRDGQVP